MLNLNIYSVLFLANTLNKAWTFLSLLILLSSFELSLSYNLGLYVLFFIIIELVWIVWYGNAELL